MARTPASATHIVLDRFATFGDLLQFLRRRAGLTQRELSIAVGYSHGQISRLEKNRRVPDPATLAARFAPALDIENEPAILTRLLELAAAARRDDSTGSPSAPRHNLPTQLTSFIGREREIAEVKRRLTPTPSRQAGVGVRLVTLTGAGGCGKTRLALQVADELLDEYPDGVWLVQLASVASPALVAQTVADTLGLRLAPGRSVHQALADHLRPGNHLLALDNCEHPTAARRSASPARLCSSCRP
jgi:transcriptional regulator with XRE-family HTH domain